MAPKTESERERRGKENRRKKKGKPKKVFGIKGDVVRVGRVDNKVGRCR